MRVSEIRVKRIRVNQGLGVLTYTNELVPADLLQGGFMYCFGEYIQANQNLLTRKLFMPFNGNILNGTRVHIFILITELNNSL